MSLDENYVVTVEKALQGEPRTALEKRPREGCLPGPPPIAPLPLLSPFILIFPLKELYAASYRPC